MNLFFSGLIAFALVLCSCSSQKEERLTGVGVVVAKDGTWYFTQLYGRR